MSSYFDAINQATNTSTGKSTAASTKDSVMGKEDFLKLLVAQLQNQDPLSPDDPTEFTAQLAQFSSLEQLFTLNESMENMVTSNANSDRFTTLNTIGKSVAYHDGSFNFSDEAVEIGYKLDGQASEVTLSIQQDGVTIATLEGQELGTGNHFMTWDGLLENGNQAPPGEYNIILQAKAIADESIGVAPLIKSEVTGVDLEGDYGGVLITKAGQIVFNSILGVYEPGSRAATSTGDGE